MGYTEVTNSEPCKMSVQNRFPRKKKITATCTFIKTGSGLAESDHTHTHIHLLQIPNYLANATELNKSQVVTQSHRIGTYAAYLCLAFPSPLGSTRHTLGRETLAIPLSQRLNSPFEVLTPHDST